MSSQSHNGGPPQIPLTAKTRIECIRAVLTRGDLSAAQKCIGAMMILQADREWSAEVKTADLMNAATAKDRETVFRATKKLDDLGIISKASVRGQAGKFTVIPPRIVDAVAEAYEELKSSRVKTDHSQEKQSGETGRHNQSASPPKAVGSRPTTCDQSGQSGRVSPDQSRAEVSNNINNNINNLTTSHSLTEQETAREGEREIAPGLFKNCSTFRHRNFVIDVESIALQVFGKNIPKEKVIAFAEAQARQWTAEIANGRPASEVVPKYIARVLATGLNNEANSEEAHKHGLHLKTKAYTRPNKISRF